MKRILISIMMGLLLISGVSAKENRLVINTTGRKVYYESKDFNKDIFMNHTEMLPGKEYTDELLIENNSRKTLDLYLKINPLVNDELLKNINMEISVDGEIVFSYIALGDNTYGDIDLGKIKSKENIKLVVKSRLDENYIENNSDTSSLDWSFCVSNGKGGLTLIEEGSTTKIIFITVMLVVILILCMRMIFLGVRILFEKDEDDEIEVLTVDKRYLTLEIPDLNYKREINEDDTLLDPRSDWPDAEGRVIINTHINGLNELMSGDAVYITYKEKKYRYELLNIFDLKEDGYAEVDNNSKCRTLTINDINKDGKDVIAIFYLREEK